MEKQTEQEDMDAKLTSPCFTKKRIFRGKVHNLSSLEAIRVIKRKLKPSQLKRFESSCFGKLFHISTNIKFSGQLVHHLLSRQVNHPNKDEMWFLVGNKRTRFSKDEFALVTGLNCGRKWPHHPHGTTRSTRLVDKYFRGQTVIRTKCLKQLFLSCEDDDDVFRLSLVYFLQALLLTREWRVSIDRHWLSLVDDLESFNRFPWGDLCYKRTLLSMKKVVNEKFEEGDSIVKPMSPKYTLQGFPYAFQIWAYEAIPLLGSKFAEKSNKNLIPRILCWESSKVAMYEELHENVFGVKNLRVMKRLRATELEKEQDYMKEITKSSFEPGENVSDCQDDTERYGNSVSMEFRKMTAVKKPEKQSKQKGMDGKLSHFFPRHINNLSTLDAIRVIKGKLNPSQLERFESSCFGKIFGTKIKFSGQIVNHLLSRQVDHPNEDEMWFLIGDKRARFSMYEFALITGLNCEPNYPSRTELDGKAQSTRLVDKYFGGRKLIYTSCLKEQFLCCEDEEDSYRLSLVYFLQALLLARNEKSSIEKQWLLLVDDLVSFDKFPWGNLCYERTLVSLKKRAREYFEENGSRNDMVKPKKNQCTLQGFPFAFQIWAYEAIPRLSTYYAEKNTNSIPRILCWERTQSPSFKELHRNVFGVKNLRVLKTLRATELEREQDYMKAMEENDIESCLELGEEHDDDEDISWGRGKGNRKRKNMNNVPFPFTECSKKQNLVTKANGNLNSSHGIDSMEINQPLEKNNNCNLQTSLHECLGRDNAFTGNGDKGAQRSNGSRIDLDAFVFGGSLYNKPLPPHICENLDLIIQHEIDLDFSRDFQQSTTILNGVVAETEVVVLSDND